MKQTSSKGLFEYYYSKFQTGSKHRYQIAIFEAKWRMKKDSYYITEQYNDKILRLTKDKPIAPAKKLSGKF